MNTVIFVKDHPIFENVKIGIDCYFVHSYYLKTSEESIVLGKSNYGIDFLSIVGKKNIVGFQFHPEKSQKNGLKLLKNFCEWGGKC